MSRIVKIVIAVVVTLLCVASMGVLAMRDASRRPEYCNTCHAVQPYYETWVDGDLLAHQHQQAGVPCQACHPQDMGDVLQENQANLQGGDAVQIATSKWTDEQCLSCHGDAATLAERTQNLDPNPHAMPHEGADLQCTQCHKMHAPSEDPCIQCHTDVELGPGWSTEVTQTVDIQVWSPDMDCTTCHSMEPYVDSLGDTNLLANAHAQQGLTCRDCHTDEAALQEAHENATPGARIKPLTVTMDVCLGCHVANQHTNLQQIIERTQDFTIRNEKVNPHAITIDGTVVQPTNPTSPHASGNGAVECSNCHKMHKASPGINYCYTRCHHQGNFESCDDAGCHG